MTMFLKVFGALLLLLHTFCNGTMYLDDPAFGPKTDYGMSRARSPTYDYQFDPEIYLGYNRQDNVDNGTAVGASGLYLITKDVLHLRIDSRDCKKNKKAKPKACICYPSLAVKAANPICDGKVLAHICQREKSDVDGATYTTVNGAKSKLMKLKTGKLGNDAPSAEPIESVHVQIDLRNTSGANITGTNYLGGGLHMANAKDDYIPNFGTAFFFTTEGIKVAQPNITQHYPLNKDFQVDTLDIYFPTKDNCARLDYHGLAYAPKLLFVTAKEAIDMATIYQPDKFDSLSSSPVKVKECSCGAKCKDL